MSGAENASTRERVVEERTIDRSIGDGRFGLSAPAIGEYYNPSRAHMLTCTYRSVAQLATYENYELSGRAPKVHKVYNMRL